MPEPERCSSRGLAGATSLPLPAGDATGVSMEGMLGGGCLLVQSPALGASRGVGWLMARARVGANRGRLLKGNGIRNAKGGK